MILNENQPIRDIVVLIEATANLGPYYENLKISYLLPALEFFNGCPPEKQDYGNSINSTMFSLVTFYGTDHSPSLLTSCTEPTANCFKFIQYLDNIDFASGFSDSASQMSEGLSTALQLFDDMELLRKNGTTEKLCLLFCNSTPYPLTNQDITSKYSGRTEQLVKIMAEKNIRLSIFSPRKLPSLLRLHETNCTDKANSLKNFAVDSRHLVLLYGFSLTERSLSPSLKIEDNSMASNKMVSNAPANRVPAVSIVRPQTILKDAIENSTNKSSNSLQRLTVASNIYGQDNTNIVSTQPLIMASASLPTNQGSSHSQLAGVDINNPQAALNAAATQQQKRIIWMGTLEWIEKLKVQTTTRVTRSLSCQVILMPDDQDVGAIKWPEKLTMNLFPQTVLQPLQSLFRTSKSLIFTFTQNQDQEALASLYKSLSTGFGGCIHFQSNQESPTDIKVVMLLFSTRKKQFLGLIPSDQNKFLNCIRAVINKHKNNVMMQAGDIATVPQAMSLTTNLANQQMQYPHQTILDARQQQQFLAMQHQQMQRMQMHQQMQLQQQSLQQQSLQQLQQSLQQQSNSQPLRHLLINNPQSQQNVQQQIMMRATRGLTPQQQMSLQQQNLIAAGSIGQGFGQMNDDLQFDLS